MKIIIFDHKNQLIFFETYVDSPRVWVHNFFMDEKLLSPDNHVAQEYVENFIKIEQEIKKIKFHIFDLQDRTSLERIAPKHLIPGGSVGMTVLSLSKRTMITLNEFVSPDVLSSEKIKIILQNPNDQVSEFFETKEEENIFLEKVYNLLVKDYLTPAITYTPISDVNQVLQEYQDKIKKRLSGKTIAYGLFSHNFFYLKANVAITGWNTKSSSLFYEAESYTNLMDTICESGLIITPKQEAAWHRFYKKHNKNGALVFERLMTEREKESLQDIIARAPIPTATDIIQTPKIRKAKI